MELRRKKVQKNKTVGETGAICGARLVMIMEISGDVRRLHENSGNEEIQTV